MKTKLLTLFFALMLSVGMMGAAKPVQIDDLYYYLVSGDKTAKVTYGQDKYTGDIVIPSSVTYNGVVYSVTAIGYSAFSYCSELTSVEMPATVKLIDTYAFRNSNALTQITIPNSVTELGTEVFAECSSLETVVLSNSLTSISEKAFSKCTALSNVEIPISVTSIEGSAFYYCTGLTSIVIPNSVTNLADWAFCGAGLTSVTLSDGITNLGSAFQFCSALKSLEIPYGVVSIGERAFAGCKALKEITIPNSVTTLEDYSLSGASLSSVYIPASVTKIGFRALAIDNMPTIEVDEANEIYSSVDGVLFDKQKKTLIQFPRGKRGSYTVPSGVETIADAAFYDCTYLTSITVPGSVTTIGDNAFYTCHFLRSVEIGENVTYIGKSCFHYCHSLQLFACRAVTPPDLGSDVFLFVSQASIPLYVPETSIASYQAKDQWKEFSPVLSLDELDGLHDISADNQTSSKLLRDGQLFILSGDKIYNASGVRVK